MVISENTAIIDNDFLIHFTESNVKNRSLCDIFKKILDILNKNAAMHFLVKEKELSHSLKTNQRAVVDELFNKGIVETIEKSDILKNKALYVLAVRELYSKIKKTQDEDLPMVDDDVITYWRYGKSLGDVHSLAVCMLFGCSIFLSDDSDSKTLVECSKSKSLSEIKVYNRKDLINLKEITNELDRKTKKSIAHQAK